MAQIWKRGARKPAAFGKAEAGYYPTGVGGKYNNTPCIYLAINSHRVIMPVAEFVEWFNSFKRCDPEMASIILAQLI